MKNVHSFQDYASIISDVVQQMSNKFTLISTHFSRLLMSRQQIEAIEKESIVADALKLYCFLPVQILQYPDFLSISTHSEVKPYAFSRQPKPGSQ